MYPGSTYSTRPTSPTFVQISSPPLDYPTPSPVHRNHHNHHRSMSMRRHHHISPTEISSSSVFGRRNEIIFPEDDCSIEFCVTENPNELFSSSYSGSGDTFSERRRQTRRNNNNKFEVEQQVKWTRNNISATMERFEPTTINTSDYMASQSPSINHVYSYAYYEPSTSSLCHGNVHQQQITQPQQQQQRQQQSQQKQKNEVAIISIPGPSKSPPRNSIKALLARKFRSKTLSRPSTSMSTKDEKYQHYNTTSYTTHYGTQENLYEEVNDQKVRKVLSDNRIEVTTSQSENNTTSFSVKEELRRVQHNHFRVLDELNLSLEALIMPTTPPDSSPVQLAITDNDDTEGATALSVAHTLTRSSKRSVGRYVHESSPTSSCSSSFPIHSMPTGSSNSMEMLTNAMRTIEMKDHTCINPEFDDRDLDSGFSDSGSSNGAGCNDSFRCYRPSNNAAVAQVHTTPTHKRNPRPSTSRMYAIED